MSDKPSLPKGTRDFGPAQMARRNYIFDTIRAVFQKFGYAPLETPSMEKLSVLTGKYGDEGDQLLFKILDNGDFFSSVDEYYNLTTVQMSELTIYFKEVLDEAESIVRDLIEETKKLLKKSDDLIALIREVEKIALDKVSEYFADKIKNRKGKTGVLLDGLWPMLEDSGVRNRLVSLILDMVTESDRRVFSKDDSDKTAMVFYKNDLVARDMVPAFSKLYTEKQLSGFSISQQITNSISGKGLRYDLTVPFARYVVMNQHEITFPFRRYQIQPVWRAERPQKGRYREFYQCDADVVGTNSLICEAEIVLMLEEVFGKLGLIDYTIKVNNRKVLHGLVETLGAQGKETDLLVAIDKLDKIGVEKVTDELRERGFSDKAIQQLQPIFSLTGSNERKLATLSDLLTDSAVGQEGIAELREVFSLAEALGSDLAHLELDVTLARGLSYYTGAIFEVKSNQGSLTSSISGGGRYDDLTGIFGLPDVSGVGISFGVDRLYDVLEELNLFPEESNASTQVLLINFDRQTERQILPLLTQLRQADIATEMYPEPVKLKKQFAYADKKGIPYALVIGSKELASQQYSLKDLRSGEQEALSMEAIIQRVKQ